MAKPDLDNPRMIAAMKVTGILEADLEPKPKPADDAPGSPRTGAAMKHELQERKRLQLVRSLEITADALDDADVGAILSPVAKDSGGRERVNVTRAVAQEKTKLEEQRLMFKESMRSEVVKEMERMRAFDSTAKVREEEKKKKVKEKVEGSEESAKKEAAKVDMETKLQAKWAAAKKQERDKRREVTRKLNESSERAEKALEAKMQERSATQEERSRRMADIANRNMQHQQEEEARKLAQHADSKRKEVEVQDRLNNAQKEKTEKAEERNARFSDKMAFVREQQTKQQEEKEALLVTNIEKLHVARTQYQAVLQERSASSKASREKYDEKTQANIMSVRKEKREWMKKVTQERNTHATKSIEVREKYVDDTITKRAEFREIFTEIVHQNKARNDRAEECSREQVLSKVTATRDRISGMLEERQKIKECRTLSHKDQMVGRMQLMKLKEVVQDASTKRINNFLRDFDLPLLPTELPNQGEDSEQKQ